MTSHDTSALKLLTFVERIEGLEAEKKAMTADIGEVYAAAKAAGFDRKRIRTLIKRRAIGEAMAEEEDSTDRVYLQALKTAEDQRRAKKAQPCEPAPETDRPHTDTDSKHATAQAKPQETTS